MSNSLSILFASSEVYPFAKTGGLADVAYSLPKALDNGHTVEVVMPLYQAIDREKYKIKPYKKPFTISMGGHIHTIEPYSCQYEDVKYLFMYTPQLCDRKELYGRADEAYEDNHIRFGIFNYILLELLKEGVYDIVHLNDWQCGLLPLLLSEEEGITTKSIFTIHNLAYQGLFEEKSLHSLGISEHYFTPEYVEFYGQVNFMKAAIAFSDAITTVSPTYAKEILSKEFGCGLEGFLNHYSHKLTGIVNGIDTGQFSPVTDRYIENPYVNLRGKAINKRKMMKSLDFTQTKAPLIAFVGRFTWQKGLDLLLAALLKLADMPCNVVILGSGDVHYEDELARISKMHENIYLSSGFNEEMAHKLYASSDFFLMPSLFEPCGLAQMIAMNYGSMPIVHHVGGLADTVSNIDTFHNKSENGHGVVFHVPGLTSLLNAVSEALSLYENKRRYNKIVKHNMVCDFSWEESSRLYIKEYENIIEESYHG